MKNLPIITCSPNNTVQEGVDVSMTNNNLDALQISSMLIIFARKLENPDLSVLNSF